MVAQSRIGIEASTNEVNLAAGEGTTVQLTITNAGYVVDAFDLTVRGLNPTWYTIVPERLSLFPHASGSATLQIKPPVEQANVLAGDYAFEAIATSRDVPGESGVVPMRLWLAAIGDLSIGIEPQRIVARKGTFRLQLTNDGNRERPIVMRPSDPEGKLDFSFGKAESALLAEIAAQRKSELTGEPTGMQSNISTGRSVGETQLRSSDVPTQWIPPGPDAPQGALEMALPPGSRVEIPLSVVVRDRIWFGASDVPLKFDVVATPPGVEWEEREARRVVGELVYRPILAAWTGLPVMLRRGLLLALPLLLLALILYQVSQGQENARNRQNNANATQTALAAAILTQQAGGSAAQTAAAKTATAAALAGGGGNSATQTAEAAAGGGIGSATQTALALTGPLRILRFDWASPVDENGIITVTWEVTSALTVTLNTTPVALTGSQMLDTKVSQSLTLNATDGRNLVSQSKGVLLMQAPDITSFTAEPSQTCPGCEITLSWSTVRADVVSIDGTPVSGTTGSTRVQPNDTTEYLLTAQNAIGQVERVLNVTVAPGLPTPTPISP